jgi:hypothetical protein
MQKKTKSNEKALLDLHPLRSLHDNFNIDRKCVTPSIYKSKSKPQHPSSSILLYKN